MFSRASRRYLIALTIGWLVLAPAAQAQRARIITGPSTVYRRGYSPSFPASAGFTYQAGYAAPMVIPNFTSVPAVGPYGAPRPVPYLTTPTVGYMNTYPGYGFGFGSGYGFGSGFGYGYPGYNFGFGSTAAYPPNLPMGVYAPPRVILENGYYRR